MPGPEQQEQIIDIPGVGQVAFPASMSDDQIASAAAKLHAEAGGQREAETRQPSTYLQDVGNFALEELKGGGEALLGAIDPRTYYNLGKDVLTNRGRNTLAGFKSMGSEVLKGNPRAIGNVLGGVVAGKALPTVVPKIPNAMVKAGNAIDRGAGAVAQSSPGRWGLAGSIAYGNPKGVAMASTPYVAQGAGKILAKGGKILGGGKPKPTKWMEAPEYGPPEPASVPDIVPESAGDPSFAAVGDEASYNATRPAPTVPLTEEATYQSLLEKLGGREGMAEATPPGPPMQFTPSRSHGPRSTIPGAEALTEGDVQALGINPSMRILKVKETPSSIRAVNERRAIRHRGHQQRGVKEMNERRMADQE